MKKLLIYDRGFRFITLSVSFLLPSCEETPPESLPASDTISSPKSDMPVGEPCISKETVEQSSNCEFLLKIYLFLLFGSRFHQLTKLTYTPTLFAIYALTPYQIEVSLHERLGQYTSACEPIYK